MVNSGTTAGQHDILQRTSTYERPFTCEGNYLVFMVILTQYRQYFPSITG